MPFTLAHPIATAPIWWVSRRRLDLSALFMGSVVPDIAYFIHLEPTHNIGHSSYGVMMEGVPGALVLLGVMHYGLKQPCLALLPPRLAQRISPEPYRFFPLSRLMMLIVSIVLGAFSHIGWDSFTHANGWGVLHFPGLQRLVGPFFIYKWLQYSGGVFGLLALGFWFYDWLTGSRPRYPVQSLKLRNRFGIGMWVAIATTLFTYHTLARTASFSTLMVNAVITVISGSILSFCLYAVGFWTVKIWRSH